MRGVIPGKRLPEGRRRRRRGRPLRLGRKLHKRRNVVERAVGGLKRSRRPATRYVNLAVNSMAVVRSGIAGQLLRALCSDRT